MPYREIEAEFGLPPARCVTGLCAPDNGDCLACGAAQGETCRAKVKPQALNPRAARHLAVVSLFVGLLDEIAMRPASERAPSEEVLIRSCDPRVVGRLVESLALARAEMARLAPAVLTA